VIVYDCACHIAAAAVLTAASRSRDRDSSTLPERRDRGDRLLADGVRFADRGNEPRSDCQSSKRRLAQRHSDFNEPNLSRHLALVDHLKEIARRRGRSAGEVAVASDNA
jgi:hypothetical protein